MMVDNEDIQKSIINRNRSKHLITLLYSIKKTSKKQGIMKTSCLTNTIYYFSVLMLLLALSIQQFQPVQQFGIDIITNIHEANLLPDIIQRFGARFMTRRTFKYNEAFSENLNYKDDFINGLKKMPIAVKTENANEQHYTVDTRFFDLVLGKHKKYSSALYPSKDTPVEDASRLLADAEIAMLKLYASRLNISDTKTRYKIMDIGCGWGSITLWFAENFPNCHIVGFSNSKTQRKYILGQAKKRNLKNVEIVTGNIDTIKFDESLIGSFDRLISIEMFEHMKNYEVLLEKISPLLKPNGLMFIHIFVSRVFPRHYVVESDTDWMTKYFFEGGTLPSEDTLLYFQNDFALKNKWNVNGKHYSLTLEAWLQNMDREIVTVRKLFNEYYGEDNAVKWIARWRTFFIACSEFFGLDGGGTFYVSHYLFEKR
jgi:cyclopropane-fatty-acyl-phospholipid synthase